MMLKTTYFIGGHREKLDIETNTCFFEICQLVANISIGKRES